MAYVSQGIETKFFGPTNSKGSRIRAVARKASASVKAMALTMPYDYSGSSEQVHAKAAEKLATKLGWAGVWFQGGSADECGYNFVNAGSMAGVALPGAAFQVARKQD